MRGAVGVGMQTIDNEQLRHVIGGVGLEGLTGMMGAAGPMLGGIAQIIAACKSGKGGDQGQPQGDPQQAQAAAAAQQQQGPAGAGQQVAACASMQMGPPPPRRRSVSVETGSM